MSPIDQKYIEDPDFLNWVFHTTPAIELYWENYLLEHPEEKCYLLELKDRLAELKFSDERLSVDEKKALANRVISRIDQNLNRNQKQLLLTTLMRYAAVAIVFAAIGGLLVYLNMGKRNIYQEIASQTIRIPSSTQGSLLITSNGENVNLKKTNSTVDYSHNGAIVLNNDSVIQATADVPDILNQLVIPYGNQSRIVLSDSTIVWLNAGSRLVYPTLFKNKTREVFLSGEAYFEVASNPGKPFIVKTSEIDIKVLGTKFNISDYAEDNVIQTVLKEGSVAIRRNRASFFEDDILIKPNQMASFNKTRHNTKIYKVDADYYSLWTKGLISFDEDDFNRVIKKVERFYNISIIFSNPKLESMRISGKLDLNKSQTEVMEYLRKVSLSKFVQINENQYIIK